ncbi:MAG: tRNA epoxyqueuosine(34) reductase QueG [Solirubrobacterales bacterium]
MDFKESIKEYCKSIGLDTIGFSKCRVFHELEPYFESRKKYHNEFEEEDIEKRINPFIYMKDGKTIITIAFPYFHGTKKHEDIYFSKYTLGYDYHVVLAENLRKICSFIESIGGRAIYFTDNNSLPERYIAKLSGIGFQGKNNTIITEKYGSYVFLGEIITDLNIEEDKPVDNKCGSCNVCIASCPTGSLGEDNPNICLSYITQKKDIDDKWFKLLNGRIFGCDSCQDICPYNKNIEFSNILMFKPLEFMEHIDVKELFSLNNKVFNEKYKKTSAGWRGKSLLQRNALINLFYNKEVSSQDIKDLKFSSPRLQHIYNRLLNIFKL